MKTTPIAASLVCSLAVTGLLVLSCGAARSDARPQVEQTTVSMASLHQRAMTLPTLVPGAPCPVSSRVRLKTAGKLPSYGLGTGPVYVSGQWEWFSGVSGVMVLTDPGYSGPVLIRGRQLDGPHGMPLEGVPPSGLELDQARSSPSWRVWRGQVSISGPGCYGLQIDGATFTETVVFNVKPGPPPPG